MHDLFRVKNRVLSCKIANDRVHATDIVVYDIEDIHHRQPLYVSESKILAHHLFSRFN